MVKVRVLGFLAELVSLSRKEYWLVRLSQHDDGEEDADERLVPDQ